MLAIWVKLGYHGKQLVMGFVSIDYKKQELRGLNDPKNSERFKESVAHQCLGGLITHAFWYESNRYI